MKISRNKNLMKKTFFIVITLLTVNYLVAQKARFGLKAGLNLSNIEVKSSSPSPSFEFRTNFNAGLLVEINVNSKLSIQPELYYSGQGANFNQSVVVNGTNYNTSNTLKFGYINLPIMLKYSIAPKVNLEFGPQVGFLVNADLKVNVNGQSVTNDIKSTLQKQDFGLNFGLGFKATTDLELNARYGLGLTNIAITQPNDNDTIKKQCFFDQFNL